jgi:hypothetical protein
VEITSPASKQVSRLQEKNADDIPIPPIKTVKDMPASYAVKVVGENSRPFQDLRDLLTHWGSDEPGSPLSRQAQVLNDLKTLPRKELEEAQSRLAAHMLTLSDKLESGQMKMTDRAFEGWSLLDHLLSQALAAQTPPGPAQAAVAAKPASNGRQTESISGRPIIADGEPITGSNVKAFVEREFAGLSGNGDGATYLRDHGEHLTAQLRQLMKNDDDELEGKQLNDLLIGRTAAEARNLLNRVREIAEQAALSEASDPVAVQSHLVALGRQAFTGIRADGHCLYHALNHSLSAFEPGTAYNDQISADSTRSGLTETITDLSESNTGQETLRKIMDIAMPPNLNESSIKNFAQTYGSSRVNLANRISAGIDKAHAARSEWGGVEEAGLFAVRNGRPVVVVYSDGSRICHPDGRRELVKNAKDLASRQGEFADAIVITNTSGAHFESTVPLTASPA